MKKKTLLTAVFLAAALAFASAPVTGLAADKNTKTAVKTQTIKAKKTKKSKGSRFLRFFKNYKAPEGTTVRFYENNADGERVGGLLIYKSFKDKHSVIGIGKDGSISAYSIKKENGKYRAYLVYNPVDADVSTGQAIAVSGSSATALKPMKFVIHTYMPDDDSLKEYYESLCGPGLFMPGRAGMKKVVYKGQKDGVLEYLIKYSYPYFDSHFKGMSFDKAGTAPYYLLRTVYVDKKTKRITRILSRIADGSKVYIDYTYNEDYEDFTDTAEPEEIDKEQYTKESSDMLYTFAFETVGNPKGMKPIPKIIKPVSNFVDQIFKEGRSLWKM